MLEVLCPYHRVQRITLARCESRQWTSRNEKRLEAKGQGEVSPYSMEVVFLEAFGLRGGSDGGPEHICVVRDDKPNERPSPASAPAETLISMTRAKRSQVDVFRSSNECSPVYCIF